MNAKLTIAALALLGVPVLLVSAPAQQPRSIPNNPGSSTDSDQDKGLPIHVTSQAHHNPARPEKELLLSSSVWCFNP